MAVLALPGSNLSHAQNVQIAVDGNRAATESSFAGEGASTFPDLLEGLVGQPAVPAAEGSGEGGKAREAGMPAAEGRHFGKHAGGRFTALERLIARTTIAASPTAARAEGEEVDSATVQSPRAPDPPIREAAAAEEGAASDLCLRVARQPTLQARVQVQPVAEHSYAKPEVDEYARVETRVGAPLCEVPSDGVTVGARTPNAGTRLAPRETATAPRLPDSIESRPTGIQQGTGLAAIPMGNAPATAIRFMKGVERLVVAMADAPTPRLSGAVPESAPLDIKLEPASPMGKSEAAKAVAVPGVGAGSERAPDTTIEAAGEPRKSVRSLAQGGVAWNRDAQSLAETSRGPAATAFGSVSPTAAPAIEPEAANPLGKVETVKVVATPVATAHWRAADDRRGAGDQAVHREAWGRDAALTAEAIAEPAGTPFRSVPGMPVPERARTQREGAGVERRPGKVERNAGGMVAAPPMEPHLTPLVSAGHPPAEEMPVERPRLTEPSIVVGTGPEPGQTVSPQAAGWPANSTVSPILPPQPSGTSERQVSKTSAEQVLPIRPRVADMARTAQTEARDADEPPVVTRLDDWLKSPAAGTAGAVTPRAEAATDSPPAAGEKVVADVKVRAMAIGTPDLGEVAFAVQLAAPVRPMSAPVEIIPAESPGRKAATGDQRTGRTAPALQVAPAVVEEVAAATENSSQQGTAEREKKQAGADRSEPPAAAADPYTAAISGPAVKMAAHFAQSSGPRQEAAPGQAAAPDASQARLEDAARSEPKPEIPSAPARQIKLEINGGERRVEVRLSERAGEVRVAVRTQDSQLAGTLRENLPELATRLAEAGLRNEIWRPADSSAREWRPTAETPAGSFTQDQQSRGNGGDSQGDARQRHTQDFQEPKTHKEKGKDFAWLMSSLR